MSDFHIGQILKKISLENRIPPLKRVYPMLFGIFIASLLLSPIPLTTFGQAEPLDGESLALLTEFTVPSPEEMMRMMQGYLDTHIERSIAIDPGKYEPRHTIHAPIFVIHETTMPGRGTVAVVNRPNYRASFHVLVLRDGTIYYMVPPTMAAWTAGYSQFKGEYDLAPSGRRTVNYFAYQVELESPSDGYWCRPGQRACIDGGGRGHFHSGYSDEQYMALAWLARRTGVSRERITTHAEVDLSNTRTDPRSFDWDRFWQFYDVVETPVSEQISIMPSWSVSSNSK